MWGVPRASPPRDSSQPRERRTRFPQALWAGPGCPGSSPHGRADFPRRETFSSLLAQTSLLPRALSRKRGHSGLPRLCALLLDSGREPLGRLPAPQPSVTSRTSPSSLSSCRVLKPLVTPSVWPSRPCPAGESAGSHDSAWATVGSTEPDFLSKNILGSCNASCPVSLSLKPSE